MGCGAGLSAHVYSGAFSVGLLIVEESLEVHADSRENEWLGFDS